MSTEPDRPLGPRGMAELLASQIADLEAQIAMGKDATEAKQLRKALKLKRNLLRWCKTRAGY
jgi:hypothetical protein